MEILGGKRTKLFPNKQTAHGFHRGLMSIHYFITISSSLGSSFANFDGFSRYQYATDV